MDGLIQIAPLLDMPGVAPLPQELLDITQKIQLLEKGIPLDWMIRAKRARTIDQLIHLLNLQEKWGKENLRVVANILKEHERIGGGLLDINEPPAIHRVRTPDSNDEPDVFYFTCRLLELVQKETVIWDRQGDPNFGYHQPMRQAWCNISFKMGGWGAMQHVQMIKSIYRKKRDQYNVEYSRQNTQFQYYRNMEFLNGVIDMTARMKASNIVPIDLYVEATCSEINYEHEINGAPEETAVLLNQCENLMDEVQHRFGDEALSEFLTLCCNDIVESKENIVKDGLQDSDWVNFMDADYDIFDEEADVMMVPKTNAPVTEAETVSNEGGVQNSSENPVCTNSNSNL